MPGSGQWEILTDLNDECWHCGQHVLSVFIWNQRLGQLAENKNPHKKKYFEDQISKFSYEPDDFMPPDHSYTPRICAKFTNWQYKDMTPILEYCKNCDLEEVDVVTEAIQ